MNTRKKDLASHAILHDYIMDTDGGSRLCTILGRAIGADLYYGFRSPKHPFFEVPYAAGIEQPLMRAINIPLLRQIALTSVFNKKTKFISQYQSIIFSGFYAPLAAHHLDGKKGIYYCHTPPRFLFDQREFYLSTLPVFARPLLKTFTQWYALRYEAALPHLQTIVTNSSNVQHRIRKYLNRDAIVIYPPCDTQRYNNEKSRGYYLSMGRLDPLKRIDKIILAFKQMPDKKLVITSSGPQETNLKKLASGCDNISFTGQLSEGQLRKTIAESIATIYIPKQEDFGMCAVESMAAGKPVIAAAEGGLLETVIPEETGILIPKKPQPEDVITAVTALSSTRASQMKSKCLERAMSFDTSVFVNAMKRITST